VSETKPKAPKSTSARKKAEVARAEKKDDLKTVDFRGLTLHLPPKLPGTLLFDFADLETGNELGGTMQMIKSLVGEGQYQAIRAKVGEEGITFEEVEPVLQKLVEDILEAFGVSSGE
jgi:hypothetical protein